MRGKLIFLLLILFQAGFSQSGLKDTLSVDFEDLPLEIVLDSISYKTAYNFAYNSEIIPRGSLYSYQKSKIHVDDLLSILLVGTSLKFLRVDDQIILKPKVKSDPPTIEKYSTVSGWVRELNSKKPIVGANVYLDGTTIGSVTDKNGNYQIREVPSGNFTLVFSHVNYELGAYSFSVDRPSLFTINGLLDDKVYELPELEITFSKKESREWEKNYQKFQDKFLGKTQNASRCEIINPDVLDFYIEKDSGKLYASASEALIIRNNSTGFELNYDLNEFWSNRNQIYCSGKAFFKTMEPENRRIRKRWMKNRSMSYQGSMLHFLHALINNDLKSQGFRLYKIENLSDSYSKTNTSVKAKDIVTQKSENEWEIEFDGYLLIVNKNELESDNYLNDVIKNKDYFSGMSSIIEYKNKSPSFQRSVLKLKGDHLSVDKYGNVKEENGFITYGYWYWERVAELMPADFKK